MPVASQPWGIGIMLHNHTTIECPLCRWFHVPRPLSAQEGGAEVEVQDQAATSRAKYFLQLADGISKQEELLEYVTSQLKLNGLTLELTEGGKGVIVSATSERLLRQVYLVLCKAPQYSIYIYTVIYMNHLKCGGN